MSQQTEQTQQTEKDEKKNKVRCCSCYGEIEKDHTFLRCPQGHHLCQECTTTFVNITTMPVMSPEKFPPKCPMCKVAFNHSIFERNIMNEQFISLYQSLLVFTSYEIGEGEKWVDCIHCDYREIRKTDEYPNFIFCKSEKCKKVTCYFCLNELKAEDVEEFQDNDNDIETEGEDDEEEVKNVRKHLIVCGKYGPMKKAVEELISNTQVNGCPRCGVKGQKNEACTHMTCDNCQLIWCYMCCKPVNEVDSENIGNNDLNEVIAGHNESWDTNEKRCPMYLSQICEVDDDGWDESMTDRECLDKLHNRNIVKSLHEFWGNNKEEFVETVKIFPAVTAGISLEEIVEFDPNSVLFQRRDPDSDMSDSESD